MNNFKYGFSTPNIVLKKEDYSEIENILNSGWVSIGKHMNELESIFKSRFNVKHAIACSNATTGLIISIKSCGFSNKKIALPAFTWPSTLYALESCLGNAPVFCDINKDTWLMENVDEEHCDVAIPVDIFGNQSDSCKKIPTIIDAAHGFDLPKLGHRGVVEVVSLSFTKIVTATEGGMILTQNDSVAETATELRRLSGRMSEINAFIAKKSIEYYDNEYKNVHGGIIEKYRNKLNFSFKEQKVLKNTNHSVYAILLDSNGMRNAVANAFVENGFESKVYYEPLVFGLPNTDYVYDHILPLPTHPNIIKAQDTLIDIINTTVESYLKKKAPGKNYMEKIGYLKK